EFLGYDTETAEGVIVALVQGGAKVETVKTGDKVQIALNQTPFYAESGGQVGDQGELRVDGGVARITDVKKRAGVFVHFAEVTEGEIASGAPAELTVDHTRRSAIRANHSATHLLHEALRQALGTHVAQRGSLNDHDRLRFDFSHNKAMNAAELAKVEADVNAYIRQNSPVETRIMTPDDARDLGAQALFGEKYGDEVRVISMGIEAGSKRGGDGDTYSIELCGGTHVMRTGDIGLFKLVSESASASGIRRIEGLTGIGALDYLSARDAALSEAAGVLKTTPDELSARVKSVLDERKSLQSELADLRRQLALSGGGQAANAPENVNGVAFLAQVLTGVSGKDLRGLIDEHKKRLGSGVVLLLADTGGKAAIAAGVTDDLCAQCSAVDIVKAAAEALGGKGGGGRADMAQAGGPSVENSKAAINAAKQVLEG
ncbi:MAG: alanine--tRNA ligase, partial [Alphaproteobacteria bacterium]|nr:alanine--tRNA ligase [Alphaproteobacteria bacterium]